MALTDKLTAIADAIRGKTGKTDGLTLEQMPGEIEGIQTGSGGGSGIIIGNFTPAENTTTVTLDVGTSEWNYFLIWTENALTGNGVKTFSTIVFNKTQDFINVVTTNNAGTSATGYNTISKTPVINGSTITFNNETLGIGPGYFIGGRTYKWIVW